MFEFFKNFFFLEHKHFVNCDLDLVFFFSTLVSPKGIFSKKKKHLFIVEKLRRVRYRVSPLQQENITQPKCRDLQNTPGKALANLPA